MTDLTEDAEPDQTTAEPISAEPDDVEIQDVDPSLEVISTVYEINSYGVDYDVEGLVRRMGKGDIVVPSFDPAYAGSDEVGGFQRGFVWRQSQMSRFVESLLLGLPVPGIFLVRDKENKLLVLDGQQRLRTLDAFYSGTLNDKVFRLLNVQEPFLNKAYGDLQPEDRRRLDDSIIHATVLRQESPSGSQNAVYSIYERLNTGGSPLAPQEIRIALFAGAFLRGISELNQVDSWRELYGPPSPRFRDHELILRVLALYEDQSVYARPLKGFLNDYLDSNRDRELTVSSDLGGLFVQAVTLFETHLGKRAFRPERAVNAAVVDSLIVGVMRRIADREDPVDEALFLTAYQNLLGDDTYRRVTYVDTSSEGAVNARLNIATEIFATV